MSCVSFYQFFVAGSTIPSVSGSTEYTDGFYLQQGTLESLIIQLDVDLGGTAAVGTDLSDLVSKCRVVIDGSPEFDWVSGSVPILANGFMGRFGHFLNSIGGRSFTVPTAGDVEGTAYQCWMAIPLGINLKQSTPRCEVTIGFNDGLLTLGGSASVVTASSSTTYMGKYNSNVQRQTKVISATSHAFAGSNITEQATARIPQLAGNGWTVLGAYIQNDSEADQYSSGAAIRSTGLSQFGLPVDFQRWASGELSNGSAYTLPGTSAIAQTYTASRAGCLFMPLYDMAAGDLTFLIASSAATTRFITPILTRNVGAINEPQSTQTAAVKSNVSRSVIARTEADA